MSKASPLDFDTIFSRFPRLMVGSPRENWNCIFTGLQLLDERLEHLGLTAIMQVDANLKPDLDIKTDGLKSQMDDGGA